MNVEVFLLGSSFEIQLHWATAVIAFGFGLANVLLSKGTKPHIWRGRIYAVLMMLTASAAFFIRSGPVSGLEYLTLKGMSFIHIFIPITMISVPLGVIAARKGKIGAHKRHMMGSFIGALVIAGAFTFLPGRRMNDLFFADDARMETLRGWWEQR